VLYAYQDFADGVNGDAARRKIVAETLAEGFKYVAGGDSRRVGTPHPDGNLWDNGADAIDELEHLLRVREFALARFSNENIRIGRPEATIEEVLVPIYLLHRYQLQAVGKLIGGSDYRYSIRGDGQAGMKPVAAGRQQQAIDALLATLQPDVLRLPAGLAERILPRPPGFPKSRETFSGSTGVTFDPLAPAASAVALTLEVLLEPSRAARMNRYGTPVFRALLDELLAVSWFAASSETDSYDPIEQQTNQLILDSLMRLAVDATADDSVRADALVTLDRIYARAQMTAPASASMRAHLRLARHKIERAYADPASVVALPRPHVPPGSPIGSGSGYD
jgi:hypothetical protein